MPKITFEDALINAGRAINRAPNGLQPGVIRVAADENSSEAEIFIYGDIGGWWDDSTSADEFTREIAELDVETINLRLNSPGGGVFDGVAIYNAVARHPANVIVHIDGIAASIASVIAMAGDEIRIAEGAHMMIHKPWSIALGDSETMRKEADVLDKLEDGIIDIYAARTEQDRDQLEEWVGAETWFLGKEAVDAGFADEMVPAKKKAKSAKSAMLNSFKNTPKELVEDEGDTPAIRDFERNLRDGEGMTCAQAKRVASHAAKAFQTAPHKEEPQPVLRDEDGKPADELIKLAAHIRNSV